jgi:hypothetical protein
MAAAKFLNGDAPAELCISRPSKSDALAGVALGGRTASRGEAADEIENDGDDCANAAFCAAGFVAFILNSSTFSLGWNKFNNHTTYCALVKYKWLLTYQVSEQGLVSVRIWHKIHDVLVSRLTLSGAHVGLRPQSGAESPERLVAAQVQSGILS